MYLVKTETVSIITDGFAGTPKTFTDFRVRMKIFIESGFENASIEIPYSENSHSVKITDIEAWIYTRDDAGQITVQKVDKNQIFKQKSKSSKSRNSIRFTFPGLKKGAVIEYRYSRIDKDVLYLPPWFLQGKLPCNVSSFSVTTPSYMHLQYHSVGSLPIEKDSSTGSLNSTRDNETKRSFTLHSVPAFKAEPFMTSLKDNLQRIEFSTSSGGLFSITGDADFEWGLYCTMLLEMPYFGLQFDASVNNTAAFIDSLKSLKRLADKIKAAYGFVKRKISWNGEHSTYPIDVAECWKDQTGSSGELNMLLLNLLRKARVQCYPVLVSTRENGMVDRSFPSLGQFNSMDVLATDSNKTYILDCTQKNLSYRSTPFDVLNREALLVDKQKSKWVTLDEDSAATETSISINGMLDSSGMMKGTGTITYTGIAKADAADETNKEEKNQDNTNSLGGYDGGELKIDSVTALPESNDGDTLVNKIDFHYTLSNTGDFYFLNPFMFSMLKNNPFKDTARFTDIDFGSNHSYATSIHVLVPENFSIEEVPKSKFIRMGDSSIMFKRAIYSAGNQLLIRNTFTVNRALFAKEEYKGLKSFFEKVYALINEQVVLKRKLYPPPFTQK